MHETRFQRSLVFAAVFLGLKPQAGMGCTFGAQDGWRFWRGGLKPQGRMHLWCSGWFPRLISGKLSVEDLDIHFSSGMAETVSTPSQTPTA